LLGNTDDLIKLAQKIHEKHTELGENSPIHALKDLNMAEFGSGVIKATGQRKVAKEAERTAQESTGRAASLLGTAPGQTQETKGTLLFGITRIRDLLGAVNRGNEESLTGWSFEVAIGQAKAPTWKLKPEPFSSTTNGHESTRIKTGDPWPYDARARVHQTVPRNLEAPWCFDRR